jgi:pimeloyl-ACP methyl ester carboxylesterase
LFRDGAVRNEFRYSDTGIIIPSSDSNSKRVADVLAVLSPQPTEQLHQLMPGSQLVLVPDCGHLPFMEQQWGEETRFLTI